MSRRHSFSIPESAGAATQEKQVEHMNTEFYLRPEPACLEARNIWDDCDMGLMEHRESIYDELWKWATEEGAERSYRTSSGKTMVYWMANNCQYTAEWEAFYKWMLCSCKPYTSETPLFPDNQW